MLLLSSFLQNVICDLVMEVAALVCFKMLQRWPQVGKDAESKEGHVLAG